jgi:hypothetical protein
VFGRKSRAERLKEQAEDSSFIPMATLATVYAGARPVAERLLYDDDLRDNIRVFIASARKILDELSGEDASDIITRLWDDDKLRKQVEAAAGAAQAGSKRVRGQRVRQRGGGGKFFFLLLVAGVAFLFLNPKTGPQARNAAKQAFGSITSGE